MIDMTPPPKRAVVAPKTYKVLRTRNMHTEVLLSNKDWEQVKHIIWLTIGESVVNKQRIPMIEYLGLNVDQVQNAKIHDYRRK